MRVDERWLVLVMSGAGSLVRARQPRQLTRAGLEEGRGALGSLGGLWRLSGLQIAAGSAGSLQWRHRIRAGLVVGDWRPHLWCQLGVKLHRQVVEARVQGHHRAGLCHSERQGMHLILAGSVEGHQALGYGAGLCQS